MAFGDPYITAEGLKAWLRQGTEVGKRITPGEANEFIDDLMQQAVDSATSEIQTYCGRQFNKVTEASARVYTATHDRVCLVDDFHTDTDLVVKIDTDDDGVYETTLTAGTDYLLEPLNGVVNGLPGWPYTRLRLRERSAWWFPCEPHGVQVTAQWGWAEVPKDVIQACRMIAHDTFKTKDNPFGVAGFSEFGVIRVRNSPMIEKKLFPYAKGKGGAR